MGKDYNTVGHFSRGTFCYLSNTIVRNILMVSATPQRLPWQWYCGAQRPSKVPFGKYDLKTESMTWHFFQISRNSWNPLA